MATIEERKNQDGTNVFRIQIRKHNHPIINKTFLTREDANLYVFYKERLIDNMDNFDIKINERITIQQVFEMKLENSENLDKRSKSDMENAFKLISSFIDIKKYCLKTTSEEWLECAKSLYGLDVYKGAKTENGKRKMSPLTLRRNFANASSAFSFAIINGIEIENLPLKILQTYINPLCKQSKN